jgi:hypothetical protein
VGGGEKNNGMGWDGKVWFIEETDSIGGERMKGMVDIYGTG